MESRVDWQMVRYSTVRYMPSRDEDLDGDGNASLVLVVLSRIAILA